MSPPSSQNKGASLLPFSKWNGSSLEDHLDLTAPLSEARKKARAFQLLRAADPTNYWKPLQLPEELLSRHEVIGFFVSKSDWDEPSGLESLLLGIKSRHPIVLCLPRINRAQGRISFYEIRDPSQDLVLNKSFGVLEPKANPRRKRHPTLLIIPSLIADLQGNRIGRGGGFYDKYLGEHPEVSERVGCIHSSSLLQKQPIPPHWLKPHDQSLSAIVTEKSFHQIKALTKETKLS